MVKQIKINSKFIMLALIVFGILTVMQTDLMASTITITEEDFKGKKAGDTIRITENKEYVYYNGSNGNYIESGMYLRIDNEGYPILNFYMYARDYHQELGMVYDEKDNQVQEGTKLLKPEKGKSYKFTGRFRVGQWDNLKYEYVTTDTFKFDYVPTRVIDETSNTKPTVVMTNNTQQIINSTGSIQIKGTVTDPDTQPLSVSATINGKLKTQTIQGPATNKPFMLTWAASELPDNANYTTVPVSVKDTFSSVIANHTANKIVDKVKPKLVLKVSK